MNPSMRLPLPVLSGFLLALLLMSAGIIRHDVRAEAAAVPEQGAAGITAYPNPFSDQLNVQVTGAMNKPMVIRMRSVLSSATVLEYTVTYTGPVALNTSSLAPGNYVVSVSSPNGYLLGRREVKKAA